MTRPHNTEINLRKQARTFARKRRETIVIVSLLLMTLLALSACEGTKKQLGMTRHAPDEFAVVKRAPLEMPTNFTLPPPQPGMPRPQETAPTEQARKVVFGNESATPSDMAAGEAALLQEAGAHLADPDIRRTVDAEAASLSEKDRPVANRLIGWTGLVGDKNNQPPATIVNPRKETERLNRNAETGQPVTEGKTPTIKD